MRAYRYPLLVLLIVMPFSFATAQALTSDERSQLEAQLAQVQAEQAQAQSALAVAKSKSSSLQNDLNLLAAKIRTEQLDIQAKTLLLKTLGDNIHTHQTEIHNLSAQIAQNEKAVAGLFRQMQQTDDTPPVYILFTNQSVSGFFNDLIEAEILQQDLDALSARLAVAEASSTAEKAVLETKKNATDDALYAIQQEQKALKGNQSQQTQV